MFPDLDYYASRALKGVRNPFSGLEYLKEAVVGKSRIRLAGDHVPPADNSVLEEEWDVLVVLDACRYDALEKLASFDEPVEKRRTQAPNTSPWFHRNFLQVPRSLASDVVYLSANPKTAEALDDESRFYRFERVFKTHWDSSANSVLPEVLTDIALKRTNEYRDKRVVVHYLQPHGPFVGTKQPDLHMHSYERLARNEVPLETVLDIYHTCLSSVLSEVERLVRGVSGTVVVTADHGESFGENGVYAHPPWAYSDVLIHVPWIELEGEAKQPEYTTSALEGESDDGTSVENKLKSLGYR